MRNRFAELNKYLLGKAKFLKLNPENYDSWIEDGSIDAGGMNELEEGYEILSWRYSGVITIEHINQAKVMFLLLFVRTWLQDNDDLRERYNLGAPKIELIRIDDNYFDVELTIDFVDNIFIAQDEKGPIDWLNKKWNIDGYDLWIAEAFDLTEAIKKEL